MWGRTLGLYIGLIGSQHANTLGVVLVEAMLTSEGFATSFSSTYFAHGPKKPSIFDASFSLNFFLFSIFFCPVSNTVRPVGRSRRKVLFIELQAIFSFKNSNELLLLKNKQTSKKIWFPESQCQLTLKLLTPQMSYVHKIIIINNKHI